MMEQVYFVYRTFTFFGAVFQRLLLYIVQLHHLSLEGDNVIILQHLYGNGLYLSLRIPHE